MELIDIINILFILYITHYVSNIKSNNNLKNVINNFTKKNNTIIKNDENRNDENNNTFDENISKEIVKKKLQKYARNVVEDQLTAPEKSHESHLYTVNHPYLNINEHTRGEPDNYIMVGILKNTMKDKVYQLYGRRIYPGAYEWEYYIRGRDVGGLDFKNIIIYKSRINGWFSYKYPY